MNTSSSNKLKGHLAIFYSAAMGALNMPVSKSLIYNWIDGYGLVLIRASFACICFWLLSPLFKHEKVKAKDMLTLLLLAAVGVSFNQLFFLIGLAEASTIDAAIISSMTPVFVMLIAAIFLKEPITWRKGIGVAVGLTGAMLIVFSGVSGTIGSSSLKGIALTGIAGIFYGIYLVVNRSIVTRYSPFTISKWMFLFATIMLIPFCLNHLIESRAFTTLAPISVYLRILFIALCATLLSYLLVPIGLKYIRPTTASMYNYTQPLIAAGIAIYIGQDTLTWQKPISAILIFLGVYFVTTSRAANNNSNN